MDANDFVHVNCAYISRTSGSGSESVIVHIPVPIYVPTSTAPLPWSQPAALMTPPGKASLMIPFESLPAQPSSTPPPPNRDNFDFTEYLNVCSLIIASSNPKLLNHYGYMLNRCKEGSSTLEEHFYTRDWQRLPLHELSPVIFLSHPSSTRDDDPLHSKKVNLLSQAEVASSSVQVMDMKIEQSPVLCTSP